MIVFAACSGVFYFWSSLRDMHCVWYILLVVESGGQADMGESWVESWVDSESNVSSWRIHWVDTNRKIGEHYESLVDLNQYPGIHVVMSWFWFNSWEAAWVMSWIDSSLQDTASVMIWFKSICWEEALESKARRPCEVNTWMENPKKVIPSQQ